MPQQEQTSAEKAFLDFQNLKESVRAELMPLLEQQVEKTILDTINEMVEEKEVVKEGVKITLDIEGDDVTVTTDGTESLADEDMDVNDFEEVSPVDDEQFEITADAESYEIENEMNYNLSEQEPVGGDPNMETPGMENPQAMPAAPAPEAAPAAPEAESGEAEIISGIKKLIAQADSGAAGTPEMDGEIDIVDDAGGMDMGAAPAAPAAPAPMEEIIDIVNELEIDDEEDDFRSDTDISWDDVFSNVGSKNKMYEEELFEIEIEEDEEADLEEMKAMGHGHGVRRTAGLGAGPEVAVQNRSRKAAVKESVSDTGNKDKAHYEAKLAELMKENDSLKKSLNGQTKEIKKFHESFVELRSQFNEMQTFNAKLAYANKLFMEGGFSEKEKLKIAESFDKTKTAEEAKQLYKRIISESKAPSKSIQSEISASSTKAYVPKKSEHNVLYESAEVRRMRELAGIKKSES